MPTFCRGVIVTFFLLACLPSLVRAQANDCQLSSNAIANFAGQAVCESDLSDSSQGQLRRIQQQKYDLTIKALDDFVRRKALEAEAKKRGISGDKLLELEVDRKVEDPSAGEVEAFYLAQKDHFSSAFHDIEPTLRENLRQAKIQDARTAYLKTLQEKSHVLIMRKRRFCGVWTKCG
jgi:hypothetical protein